ncbi:alpha/beta hydrolase family protein [Rhodococcus sp. JT-3]|uniref:alpha/beta hydrolase family protein n=1 Tax=Rhodococcus sp. JT-3 TaxID=1973213 RepID=UPI001302F975|nr:prolyl oligopeptidase family serine peptidase [Rhodococcus sp. JT-3]
MLELPTFSPRPHRVFSAGFYPSADFDFVVRCVLGGVPFGTADVGEVLATIDGVANNDHEHWFQAWHETGSRVRAAAEAAATANRLVSAAQAYLRAATYFAVAVNSVSGLESDELLVPTFRLHRSSWEGFVDTTDRIVERVEIPYEQGTLPGWFFTPSADAQPRPTLVMVNGSDGAISTLWSSGASGALTRGYNVLLFDGPGQQSMLFERGVGFRPDWEAVLTPVADFVLQRPDVDSDRVALYGISQGGYWIARALAFEHRFAAAIADPGVMDVAASWDRNIPSSLMKLFRAGKKDAFDRDMTLGMKFSPQTARTWNFRSRPYLQDSYFDTLTEVHRYTLTDHEAAQITTPLLVTDPEDEKFWPGQSKELADRSGGPTELSHFTAAEGANFHCQPMARLLTDERMFDWLDAALQR